MEETLKKLYLPYQIFKGLSVILLLVIEWGIYKLLSQEEELKMLGSMLIMVTIFTSIMAILFAKETYRDMKSGIAKDRYNKRIHRFIEQTWQPFKVNIKRRHFWLIQLFSVSMTLKSICKFTFSRLGMIIVLKVSMIVSGGNLQDTEFNLIKAGVVGFILCLLALDTGSLLKTAVNPHESNNKMVFPQVFFPFISLIIFYTFLITVVSLNDFSSLQNQTLSQQIVIECLAIIGFIIFSIVSKVMDKKIRKLIIIEDEVLLDAHIEGLATVVRKEILTHYEQVHVTELGPENKPVESFRNLEVTDINITLHFKYTWLTYPFEYEQQAPTTIRIEVANLETEKNLVEDNLVEDAGLEE